VDRQSVADAAEVDDEEGAGGMEPEPKQMELDLAIETCRSSLPSASKTKS